MGSSIKIFVDLDNTLTDFDKQLAELLNKKLIRGWDFGNDPEIWKKIDDAGTKFWSEMDFMPDGQELWNFIKKFNPTVLTAPSRHPSSKKGKRSWVKKYLQDASCIIDEKKDKHAKKDYVLIDDRKKNIKKWEEAGGVGVLHKNTKSTIKKLKKIMEEKDKEAGQDEWISEDGINWYQMDKEAGDVNKLRSLSLKLSLLGYEKESSYLEKVADRWEDFLRVERSKSSPGAMVMDKERPSSFEFLQKGLPKSFFPDRILVNMALDTLMQLKDQRASIIAEKIRELESTNLNDSTILDKKTELLKKAYAYSEDVGNFISVLLSLRYENRDRNKIRETESEMNRLKRKILNTKGIMREERPSIFKEPLIRTVKKDPFSKYAKIIKINPYDGVVQEAVREMGSNLNDIDMIQLEINCPGDRLAWVTNKDFIKGRPGKESVIHLCLKKIEDRFRQIFGKEYSAFSSQDNNKMKEIIKEFLSKVVIPHEYVHIQQEMKNRGEFGPSPETEAEKAEDWGTMKQFGIKKAMVKHIDRIANRLESLGLLKEAENLDIIANTIEKSASLENFYTNIIRSVIKKEYSVDKIKEFLDKAVNVLWPFPSNVNPIKGRITAWKKALLEVVKNPGDILEIAGALKLKSGELAEKTMPIADWAEMTKLTAPEFIQYVDSSTEVQPPSSNDGNPLEIR